MARFFEDRLEGFLPAFYTHGSSAEELRSFLKLPASVLDDLKELADDLPRQFDVNHADPQYLALLGQSVGVLVDGRSYPEVERRRILDAIPRYHRKGTLPALERDLRALGWEGIIEETFHDALRLNLRAALNKSRLAGEFFGLGAYRIQCFNQVQGIRDAQKFHHPAGTRAFWFQWFIEQLSLADGVTADAAMHLRYLLYSSLDESFVLNQSALGKCNHLTQKQRAWGIFQLVSVAEASMKIESAANRIGRFHRRQNRFQLNRKGLNQWRLPSGWESERKYVESHGVWGGTVAEIQSERLRLGHGVLNQDLLSLGVRDRWILFRQKDLIDSTDHPEAQNGGDGIHVELGNLHSLSPVMKLGLGALGKSSTLGASRSERSSVTAVMQVETQSLVESSISRVDRFRHRGAAFRLGKNRLGHRALTDTYITEERAAFEVRSRTELLGRSRLSSVVLGEARLNQTALRLSVDRRQPQVLGRSRLNQHVLYRATPDFRWLIHQKDFPEPIESVQTSTAKFRALEFAP